MYQFKKILVAMDLTEMDLQLIKFTTYLASAVEIEEIHFVKVAKNLDLPEGIKKEFPGIVENALKDRREKLEKEVESAIDPSFNIKYTCNVVQGDSPSKKLVKLVEKHNIDLVVAGWKSSSPGSGIIPQRLARRVPSSLFIVPESMDPEIEKILIPIDFSDDATSAVEEAVAIARAKPGIKIICQNVYTVPQGYHYSGKTYEQFASLMKKNAKKSYKAFIHDIDTEGVDIEPIYSQDINDDKVTDIRDLADEVKPDLMILGTKCRSKTTALFIGNIAEKVIQNMGKDFPMLIVRPKNEKAGLIDFIRQF